MSEIKFYKQVRDDGGIHIGMYLDGSHCFESFTIEGEEYDPALTWYVDVHADGEGLPNSATGACLWLLDRAPLIKNGLLKLADKLSVGLDHSIYPLRWPVPDAPQGVRLHVVCSVARRVTGLEMAKNLRDLATQWEETLRHLPEASALAG